MTKQSMNFLILIAVAMIGWSLFYLEWSKNNRLIELEFELNEKVAHYKQSSSDKNDAILMLDERVKDLKSELRSKDSNVR